MGEITFILGGTRSGKSEFAENLVKNENNKTAYIATCICNDEEMQKRIDLHKKRRPKTWSTIEEPENISNIVPKLNNDNYKTVLIDCLTIYISNLMFNNYSEIEILKNIENMISSINKSDTKTIIVSNEVGLGIVPESQLGRKFRDIAGKANQIVAKNAKNVYFVVSEIGRAHV